MKKIFVVTYASINFNNGDGLYTESVVVDTRKDAEKQMQMYYDDIISGYGEYNNFDEKRKTNEMMLYSDDWEFNIKITECEV